MEQKRVRVVIEGRVQGVAYRAFTRSIAISLGLKGWVRNLYDGRVEAVFEGERTVVEKAIDACRKGPPGARVKQVDLNWEASSGDARGFEIIY